MFYPARAAVAGASAGQDGDRLRDVGLPDQGDAKLRVWCWVTGHGCRWAMAGEVARRGGAQTLLSVKEWQAKPQDAQGAVADEGPMATELMAAEPRAQMIAARELAGEGALPEVWMDEEAHPAAARTV